jgi:Flp pilus assembly protein TadG
MYCLTEDFPFGSIETLQRVYRVIKSNRGQLSIFMGITLILVMGMLAFIINIGLFVKAKINLQNAVDAAAFSGAATQARQLTNIANVNWEIRNTYKEWMFKYYVLGQVGLMKEDNPPYNLANSVLAGSAPVNFLLRNISSAGVVPTDKLNVPTICVHNNASTNICPIFSLPGIPRFPALGVAGISDVHEAFVNKLVERKGENCSDRTQINFLAALSWAYSSGIKEIPGAPLIATNRAGAWPESLELAMRVRNLEMIVNRPAVQDIDYVNKDQLAENGAEIGLNERPVKAFMSAFRNLGGGKYKDRLGKDDPNNSAYDELAKTFKLTEISPKPYEAAEKSVSGFLIPKGNAALNKPYLDLQIMPVNFATLFSTFTTTTNQFEPSVQADATCGISKSALPVPGYILGFVKNPQVLTYYAVKGEADFTGLFFPSSNASGTRSFKLTAYAAAKPFGGRIGPKLVGFEQNDTSVVPRSDKDNKTSSIMSGLNLGVSSSGSVTFVPGMPIPSSQDFWVNPTNLTIGGVPEANSGSIAYGIPNMIYDFENDQNLNDQNAGTIGPIQMIGGYTDSQVRGLYNSYQMRTLKAAMGGNFAGRNMSSNDLMKSIVLARQVTKYDAANYLIPEFNRSGTTSKSNAAPTVREVGPVQGGLGIYYKTFAPLIGDNLLYKTKNEVGTIVLSYMRANEDAINSYLESLLKVANSIVRLAPAVPRKPGDPNINLLAAQSIHINSNEAGDLSAKIPPLLISADPMDASSSTCAKDMASKFNHFFRGSATQCGIVPLELLMVDYIEKKNQGDGALFYTSTYFNKIPDQQAIMTAYYPSERQGAAMDAAALSPIGASTSSSSYSTRRNFYSTKFVPLSKVLSTSSDYRQDVFLESDMEAPKDLLDVNIHNLIQADGASGLNNPYFLDF